MILQYQLLTKLNMLIFDRFYISNLYILLYYILLYYLLNYYLESNGLSYLYIIQILLLFLKTLLIKKNYIYSIIKSFH